MICWHRASSLTDRQELMIKPREDWASSEKICSYVRLFVRRGLFECENFPRRRLESLRNSFYFLSSFSFSCFHCRNLVNIQFNQQRKYNLPIVIRQMPGFIGIGMWNACIFHLRGFALGETRRLADQNHFHQCWQMKCKHNQISLAETTILRPNANLLSLHYVSDEKS